MLCSVGSIFSDSRQDDCRSASPCCGPELATAGSRPATPPVLTDGMLHRTFTVKLRCTFANHPSHRIVRISPLAGNLPEVFALDKNLPYPCKKVDCTPNQYLQYRYRQLQPDRGDFASGRQSPWPNQGSSPKFPCATRTRATRAS